MTRGVSEWLRGMGVCCAGKWHDSEVALPVACFAHGGSCTSQQVRSGTQHHECRLHLQCLGYKH